METIVPVTFFSGFILGNFYCAVALTLLRRMFNGRNGPSGRGRKSKGFPFRLPPFLMFDPKGMITGCYWLQPAFATVTYSSAVPVGEMLSFGKKSGSDKK